MKGWVGLVSWPVVDGLPTIVVTHQLQVDRETGEVRRPKTDVLPLCCATNANSATPDLRLPSQEQDIAAVRLIPNDTGWWQRHVCVCVCVCEQLGQGGYLAAERPGVELSWCNPTLLTISPHLPHIHLTTWALRIHARCWCIDACMHTTSDRGRVVNMTESRPQTRKFDTSLDIYRFYREM